MQGNTPWDSIQRQNPDIHRIFGCDLDASMRVIQKLIACYIGLCLENYHPHICQLYRWYMLDFRVKQRTYAQASCYPQLWQSCKLPTSYPTHPISLQIIASVVHVFPQQCLFNQNLCFYFIRCNMENTCKSYGPK